MSKERGLRAVIELNKAGEYVAKLKIDNEIVWWTEGYSRRASAYYALVLLKTPIDMTEAEPKADA